MVSLQFRGSYRSKGVRNPATKGKLRFSYTVVGTAKELADFKKAQGDYFVADENGKPIYNSLQFVGKNANMTQTRDGRFIPDTSAIDQAQSLAEQHPFLANAIAEKLVASLGIGTAPAPVAVAEPSLAGK
jgi:hypothetical protein